MLTACLLVGFTAFAQTDTTTPAIIIAAILPDLLHLGPFMWLKASLKMLIVVVSV